VHLSEFLRAERESILVEWEAFARQCAPAGDSMDVAALRDHAALMLDAFADDLDASQTPGAQAAKSVGGSGPPRRRARRCTVSSRGRRSHRRGRARSGARRRAASPSRR
jgi:hypothetical protein